MLIGLFAAGLLLWLIAPALLSDLLSGTFDVCLELQPN